jgi:hypothetical protein
LVQREEELKLRSSKKEKRQSISRKLMNTKTKRSNVSWQSFNNRRPKMLTTATLLTYFLVSLARASSGKCLMEMWWMPVIFWTAMKLFSNQRILCDFQVTFQDLAEQVLGYSGSLTIFRELEPLDVINSLRNFMLVINFKKVFLQ